MGSLEDRLRAHLARVARTRPGQSLEDRILHRVEVRRASARPSVLPVAAATALLVVALGAMVGLRLARQHASVNPPVPSSTPSSKTAPHAPAFWKISAVSPTLGWALTDLGLLRTTDGWRHWQAVTPPALVPAQMRQDALVAPEGGAAWLAQFQLASPDVTVFRTQDGGVTWRSSSITGLPRQVAFTQMTFADPQHGWIFAGYAPAAGSEGGALYRTVDGGDRWTKVEESRGVDDAVGSLPFGCDKAGVSFIDDRTGWATGSCAGGGPLFAVSHDGGATWAPQPLPGRPGAGSGGGVTTSLPAFFTARAGYLVMLADRVTVYLTHDGGATWVPSPVPLAASAPPPTVAFQSLDAGWAVSADGATGYRTVDGGQHWSEHPLRPALAGLHEIHFFDAQQGLALIDLSGSQTALLETHDGGDSWQQVVGPSGVETGSPSPAACGSWASMASQTGTVIAAQYGEILDCGALGPTRGVWILTTGGTGSAPGAIGVFECADVSCRDGSIDHPFPGWRFYPAPYDGAVRWLGSSSVDALTIDNAGHRLQFQLSTRRYGAG